MNPIFQALSQGHNPQQILNYLSKAIPQFAGPISKATSSGYSAKQILGFLSKNFEEDRRGMSQSERFASNRRSDTERAKHGLTMLGAAIGTPLAAYAARNALSRALPSSLTQNSGQTAIGYGTSNQPLGQQQQPLQQTLGTNPTGQQLLNQQQTSSLSPPSAPIAQPNTNITQPPNIQQSQINAIPKEKDGKRLEALKKFNKKLKKKGLLDEEIERFEKEYGPLTPTEKVAIEAEQEPTNLLPESNELVEEKKPIARNETVSTPHGVGEVKEIRNGKAIVEVDGKKHQINENELESSPLPEKELADIYEDLKKGIEAESGEEMSRHVTFLGYDPNMRQLIYMPWRGQPYTYNDVSDEEIADLKGKIDRKTTDENFIGAWEEGTESPIGAAMSEFIQKRKAAQKAKGEEKKEPIHKAKFEKLYYAYEPAEKAAEARYKERKKQAKKNPRIS